MGIKQSFQRFVILAMGGRTDSKQASRSLKIGTIDLRKRGLDLSG